MAPARIVAILLAVAAAAAAIWYFWPGNPPPPPGPQGIESAAPLPVAKVPRFPVAPPEEAPALPTLKESDPTMQEAMTRTFGAETLARFVRLEDFVRNVVATVDNLPREEYAMRLNPARPIGGPFAVSGSGDSLAVAPQNAARYAPFVAFAEGVDTTRAVALYLHFYPLFQQAYVELGYPDGYFNDRLVEVIDHLLEAPEVQGPVALTQPHVLYEYADADLEARSSGHKAMMRVGPENAARLKVKLRALRGELLARAPKPAAAP
jgi:hypothetical protein